MRHAISPVLIALAFPVLAACGGGQPPAAAPEPAPPAEPAPAPAEAAPAPVEAPATWSEALTRDQKVAFMKTHVVPKMGPIFQAANAERYKEFGCKTCHGPEFKDHPPEFLPALEIKDGKMTAMTEKPEIAKFMMEKVVPEMAAIMGMQPYDPETKTGFGCGACHQMKM
jgi:cytochrome c551/c552